MNKLTKNKIIIFLSLFLLIVLLSLYKWWWESSVAGIAEISIAPNSANILLNNRKISNGKYFLSPGDYEIKIEHPDFISDSMKFNISSKETKKIVAALKTKDGTDDWYVKNRQDDIIRSGAGYNRISEKQKDLEKNFPIIKHLPYTDSLKNRFKINYSLDSSDNKKLSITVDIDSCYNHNSSVDGKSFRKTSAENWLNRNLEDSEKGKYTIKFNVVPCQE